MILGKGHIPRITDTFVLYTSGCCVGVIEVGCVVGVINSRTSTACSSHGIMCSDVINLSAMVNRGDGVREIYEIKSRTIRRVRF